MSAPHPSDRPIVVVGAGIVGTSIAYHVARAGRAVLVLDRGMVAAGTTGDSFGWAGIAGNSATAIATGLRRGAAAAFLRLVDELDAPIALRRGGAIGWEETPEETAAYVRSHRDRGHRVELITGDEVRRREPRLREAPAVAAWAPDDVGVDPAALARALRDAALAHGAVFREQTTVDGIAVEQGMIRGVRIGDDVIEAETVVLAAGTAIPALVRPLGLTVPIEASPCRLVRFATPEPLLAGVVSTPLFEARQLDDRTILAAVDVDRGRVEVDAVRAEEELGVLHDALLGGEGITLIGTTVADRPIPRGGQPIVGPVDGVPGLYLASAHAAVSLSGAIGAKVARDLAGTSR
ncbi:glycine/D-amino acid oxidase-like deaminating enzyme [Microbacterium resistens]|uniref:Glycine/D-amino acid oxidase-like deaminating enzyme n=1 Tax=Microbacterium resistens TaxID=156977 RepID=A0ABU1SFH2_9MICO|nr:FAD-binding oxidoreductase [Microbacterium resistens]MDR6868038.1 glycine/D-amino acid oxidase-like deaminating enzyme [Microbacterium resistens]